MQKHLQALLQTGYSSNSSSLAVLDLPLKYSKKIINGSFLKLISFSMPLEREEELLKASVLVIILSLSWFSPCSWLFAIAITQMVFHNFWRVLIYIHGFHGIILVWQPFPDLFPFCLWVIQFFNSANTLGPKPNSLPPPSFYFLFSLLAIS